MTPPMVAQSPIDPKAVKALFTHWLQTMHGSSEFPDDISDGDRILDIIGALRDNYDRQAEPLREHGELALRCGFSLGVEAGLAVGLAVLSDPLGSPQERILEALQPTNAAIPIHLASIATDAVIVERQIVQSHAGPPVALE